MGELPRRMAIKKIIEKSDLTLREMRMCQISHKNIVTFFGVEMDEGTILIKMEVANMNIKSFQVRFVLALKALFAVMLTIADRADVCK